MSFDVNIGRSEPVIKAAANTNNNGGSGGNLGYMMGGGRQKQKEEKQNIFEKNKNSSDTFELSSGIPKLYENQHEEDVSVVNKVVDKVLNKLSKYFKG